MGKLSFVEGQLSAVIQEKVVDGTTRPLPTFTRREARIPAVPNKAFAVIGMRRAGKTTFRFYTAPRPFPLGHALETCILIEWLRRRAEVAYLRTPAGYEVDFVVQTAEGQLELVQVCADMSDAQTRAREIRALLDASAQFPNARLRLIALEPLPPPDIPPGVRYTYAAEWLLES